MERRKRPMFFTGEVMCIILAISSQVWSNETGSEFYQTVDEYDNCYPLECESSTSSTPAEDSLCRCDSSCSTYGDCCQTNQTDSSPLDGLLECRSVHLDERITPAWEESFWMVSGCPAQWLDSGYDPLVQDVYNNCTNGSDELPPITDLVTGTAYKNEYCAVCHGVRNFTQWGYTLACRNDFSTIASQPGFEFTFENLLTVCRTCGYREPPLSTARPCFHASLINDNCLERETLETRTRALISEELYQNIVNQCHSGPISPLTIPFGQIPYRNQYCALCNGVSVSRENIKCVNPYDVRDTTYYCQFEEVPTTEATVVTTVTTEPSVPTELSPLPTEDAPAGTPGGPLGSPGAPGRPLGSPGVPGGPLGSPVRPGVPGRPVEPFDGPIDVIDDIQAPPEEVAPLPSFTVFLDVNRNTQTVTVNRVTFNVSRSCKTGEVFDVVLGTCRKTVCQEVAMGESCQISSLFEPITINDDAIVNITGNDSSLCDGFAISLSTSEFMLLNNETLEFGGEIYNIIGFINESAVICVTGNDSSLCDEGFAISLNTSEFMLLDNETLEYGGESYDIIVFINESAVICVNFTQNGTEEVNGTVANRTVSFFTYPIAFSVLTYVGCSLSVIGCTIVLLTYSIFKELRTLPGKILMNLSAAILATSVFLLIGTPLFSLSGREELCHTTAIFLHWLVLSEFSWMTIMSLELARTMLRATHLKPTDSERTKLKIFLLYLLIGWGLPTIVTAVTTVLNYTTEYIEYGERGLCWIGDRNSLYTVFVAPLALSLVVNGVAFFITTYLLIKAQRSQAKLQKQNNISYMRIHLSVFSITGLTWSFGIIAMLVQQDWAWYVFIVLNATQGFTICTAFVFTKKVFHLYRDMFWPKISSKLSFTRSNKQGTEDTSMAIHYKRKSEKVTTASTVSGSVVDPSPDPGGPTTPTPSRHK